MGAAVVKERDWAGYHSGEPIGARCAWIALWADFFGISKRDCSDTTAVVVLLSSGL